MNKWVVYFSLKFFLDFECVLKFVLDFGLGYVVGSDCEWICDCVCDYVDDVYYYFVFDKVVYYLFFCDFGGFGYVLIFLFGNDCWVVVFV